MNIHSELQTPQILYQSHIQEVISALWLILSCLCYIAGFETLAKFILAKGIFDFACAIYFTVKEHKEDLA